MVRSYNGPSALVARLGGLAIVFDSPDGVGTVPRPAEIVRWRDFGVGRMGRTDPIRGEEERSVRMPNQPVSARPGALARGAAAASLVSLGLLGGCEVDGWLGDPSVVGRWERTPTIVPILERIDVIEADTGEFSDVSEVTPSDLLPEPIEYRISAGDFLKVSILDLVQQGFPAEYDLAVSPVGTIEIPQVGSVPVEGLTAPELRDRLAQIIKDRGLLVEAPVITVTIPGQRQAAFTVMGAVSEPGRFQLPFPGFRLLEALTDAGGVSPVIRYVYVIRQVPLSEEVERGSGADRRPMTTPSNRPPIDLPGDDGVDDINDLIEELTTDPEGGAPGALLGEEALGWSALAAADGEEPLIDIPESGGSSSPRMIGPAEGRGGTSAGSGQWIFVEGRWIQVMPGDATSAGLPEGADPLDGATTAEDLVTQRVIRVPVGPLLKGTAKYNIVIRSGDVIHVPPPAQGVVYALGPGIARPGTYNLPGSGRLTIQRLVAAAGGLSQVSIPERVDLTRVVGENRQATIRLNVRAIFEGTQPDILLKADDMVNFGTNFWATPMAVIRNGFRMSYGFGFLLDRNFGNDVFGPPPTRLEGQ